MTFMSDNKVENIMRDLITLYSGALYYDKYLKLWVIMIYDENGFQTVPAEYFHYKRDALAVVKDHIANGIKDWEINRRPY